MAKKNTIIIILLALIFGLVYVWLATPFPAGVDIGPRFDWPDETANFFWINRFAAGQSLKLIEPLNSVAENQIHPRSFNVNADGALVPGSFLGLILLYGVIAKVIGNWSVIYLTPIIAVLGVAAFYKIIKKLFSAPVALLSAGLLFIHPAWWYYSEFGLLPNVAFVSLVLFSLYFLIRDEKLTYLSLANAGFLAGLAVSIRPAEFIWLLGVYFAAAIYLKGRIGIPYLLIFLAAGAVAFAPTIFLQKNLYGGYLTSGYSQLQQPATELCRICSLAKGIILPFGFNLALMRENFWQQFVSLIWWFTVLAIIGLVILLKQSKTNKVIIGYIGLTVFSFVWLVTYYGSWQFADLQTLKLNALGASYIRYWLPLYILALPLAATAIIWLGGWAGKLRNIFIFLIIAGLFLLSADLVLWSKPDSLQPVKNRIVAYKKVAAEINAATEPDAVIITIRKDKVFFPERKVIHTFIPLTEDFQLQALLPELTAAAPVYYYALSPAGDGSLLGDKKLILVKNIGSEILYKIE